MIALGLGVHNLSVEECVERFKSFCKDGFSPNPLTKISVIGWLARYWCNSIYQTEPLQNAMKNVLGRKLLFGHGGNASRVAVTTTVESGSFLLANYNWGDGKRYLNSNVDTWFAYVVSYLLSAWSLGVLIFIIC